MKGRTMQFPMLTASEMDLARVHRRNPHDLHWRKDPPAWPGRVDSAYRRLYPHLVDEFCCMQCGAIPCPFDHAEDRDTRLQDMAFVGDIIREKKELEEQISQMKEKLTSFQQMQQKWIAERQTFQKHVYELETAKQAREKEKTGLAQEMTRLRATNTRLQQEIHSQKKEIDRIPILDQQISKMKEERMEYEAENELLRRLSHRPGDAVSHTLTPKDLDQPSERENLLQAELDQLRSNFETILAGRVQETEEQKTRMEEEVVEKTRQLEELRQRLNDSEAIEFKSLNELVDLRNELDRVSKELEAAGHVKDALEEQVRKYVDEIERLRRRLAEDRGFRRYVGVLRQLNEVKDANDTLRWKLEEKPSVIMTTLSPRAQRRESRPLAASAGAVCRAKTGRRSQSTRRSEHDLTNTP